MGALHAMGDSVASDDHGGGYAPPNEPPAYTRSHYAAPGQASGGKATVQGGGGGGLAPSAFIAGEFPWKLAIGGVVVLGVGVWLLRRRRA
jgi:hypothetical protein